MCKKTVAIIMALSMMILAAGCAQNNSSKTAASAPTETKPAAVTKLPKPDMHKWAYNAEGDVYYQLGIVYCEAPAVKNYEQLAIFVPGSYMEATPNGDGTFSCKQKDTHGKGYTAANAPVVMPVRTEGYAAAEPLTKEAMDSNPEIAEEIEQFTSQGFVYVQTGCRGIEEGAPFGVTDLKAAVRYIRYCDDVMPGDAEQIFVHGMSGGGALASVLGASGDSKLYDPYLQAIGAVQGVSDAVTGTMAWCPITDLDTANAEYEWMMGCTRQGRSEEWNKISDKLAYAYADYVNSAGFTDENGSALTLKTSPSGIYQAGSYYDYILSVAERSLNNFLSDNRLSGGEAQKYIDGLNNGKQWVTYDQKTNTASIASIEDFVKNRKKASGLSVAFDWPGSGNMLFGKSEGRGAHFDKILSGVLTELKSQYAAEYAADMNKKDSFGYAVEQRVNMYTPLYYLMKSRDGYGSSRVAQYWRIRTGIEQPTTSLTTEVNLALALKHCDGVDSVDFETVWEQGHEPVEREGDSTDNYIKWIKTCITV